MDIKENKEKLKGRSNPGKQINDLAPKEEIPPIKTTSLILRNTFIITIIIHNKQT